MSRTIPPREAKQDSSAGLRAWLGRARQQWLSGRSAGLRLRFAFLGGTLGLIVLLLVVQAANLQLFNDGFYQRQGDARFLREIEIPTSRGMITDRNGEPLAVSSPVVSIWANPQEVLQHPARLPELAEALDIALEPLTQRLAQRAQREFVYLRRHLGPDQAEAILALGVPGIYSQREFRRFYPTGEVMAQVLGITDIDDVGQEGLELAYNDWLTGKPGAKRVIRDRRGAIVENVDLIRAAEPGHDLTLSIDRRIQYLAYRELGAALRTHDAVAGSVVVLDVRNGEVLAMVSHPSFNPNARDGGSSAGRRNRVVTDVIEPGSVIKALTVAAALETGKVTPDTVIQTSPGYMPLAGHVIRDIRNFGEVSLTRLLTKSSNVAATKLAMDMPNEHFHDVLRRFGLGSSTGSGFPGESAGVLPAAHRWGTLEKATISYGYGLSVTPLQLAQAYAVLGNGGRLVAPTFVRDVHQESRQVIDPGLAATIVAMLETVTGPEGTAQAARIAGYRVAGKTGTSRKVGVGGYEKRYLSVFAGLVPATRPRFAVVVVVDDPKSGDYYGGLVAAPVFRGVMEGALRLHHVAPDRVEQWFADAEPLPAASLADAAEPVEPLVARWRQ
jgi:cell division protein FtsI (penicillin-binding protein 3)